MATSLMKVPALLFHDVSQDVVGKVPYITLSPERFRGIISWLAASGYTGISARDWLNALNGTRVLPKKTVVITFDDAYASIAEHALPVLKSYGFSATVFVVTGLVGRTNEWDTPKWRSLALMDAEQLRFWAASGVEFGSHSCQHHDLTKLTDVELAHDISSSRDELARLVGDPIVSFAYPYGLHNETVRRIVSQTFRLAFSIQEGVLTPHTDPMLCCRVEIGPSYSLLRVSLSLRFASFLGLLARLRCSLRPVMAPQLRTPAIR